MAHAAIMAEAFSLRIFVRRGGLLIFALTLIAIVALFSGLRFGLMLMIGLGFGITLEALRFGFAGPWRAMILHKDPSGILAQLLSISFVAIVALPLIEAYPLELQAARAPIGFAMVLGAFIFGIAMQVVLGCGSGTLVNAGSGNIISFIVLPFFAFGSFLGAHHLVWWTKLGAWQGPNLTGWSGVAGTLTFLTILAFICWFFSDRSYRKLPKRLMYAALLVAVFSIFNLVVSGQPWGVVYGLGLWAAKVMAGLNIDLSGSAFWSSPARAEHIQNSVLVDYTSLTNLGIIFGAFVVTAWRRGGLSYRVPSFPVRAYIATIVTGFLLGYASRLAFGCNVGAFFSGISTGSLHGWVWVLAAFAGSILGVRLRPILGLELK